MKIYGQDLAGILHTAIVGAGGLPKGTLTRVTEGGRDPDNPTGGKQLIREEFNFMGTLEMKRMNMGDSLTVEYAPVIVIIAKSIDTVPEVNDIVQFEGEAVEYKLEQLIQSDPARAIYEFKGKA